MIYVMLADHPSCTLLTFFFNDTATTEIYTLSLHDALPIYCLRHRDCVRLGGIARAARHSVAPCRKGARGTRVGHQDQKSTRLNSSHANISYAVFCLKKKKNVSFKLVRRLSIIMSVISLIYS